MKDNENFVMMRRSFMGLVSLAPQWLLAVRIRRLLRIRKWLPEILERIRPARRAIEIRGVFGSGPATISGVVTLSKR